MRYNNEILNKLRKIIEQKVTPTLFFKKYLPDFYNGPTKKQTCFLCRKKSIKISTKNIECSNSKCDFKTQNIVTLYGLLKNLDPHNNHNRFQILNDIARDFKIRWDKELLKQETITIEKAFELQLYLQMYQMINRKKVKDLSEICGFNDQKNFSKILWNQPLPFEGGVGLLKFLSFYTNLERNHIDIINQGKYYFDHPHDIIQNRIRDYR